MADEVLRLEDISDFIEEVVAKVRDGVAASRKRGILCDMPDEITFSVTVVKEWQALEIKGVEETTSKSESKQTSDGRKTIRRSNEKSSGTSEDNTSTQRGGENKSFTYTD